MLLSLDAVVFSWTRMVTMSPTRLARLSAHMLLDRPSCQSESAERVAAKLKHTPSVTAALVRRWKGRRGPRVSKWDFNSLFIKDLSAEFATGLRIAHADDLARHALLQYFNLQRDNHGAVANDRVGHLTARKHRFEPDGPSR